MKKKMSTRPVKAPLSGVILASSVMLGHAQSTIVFNSLGSIDPEQASEQGLVMNYYYSGTSYFQSLALGFTTGTNAQTLASVTLNLWGLFGGGDLQVGLYSNSGGTPGSELALLAGNDSPTNMADYVYTPAGSVTLNAGTTYWVTVADLGGAQYDSDLEGYRWLDGRLATGTLAGYLSNPGSGWQSYPGPLEGMEVTGNPMATPEPGTVALGALGAVAWVAARRRSAARQR